MKDRVKDISLSQKNPVSLIILEAGQRYIPEAEGCSNSIDNGIYIHAVVPRHVETGHKDGTD